MREVRELAGKTQRQLALDVALYYTVVHRCETGDRRIDPIEFAWWCKACGADPGDLLRRAMK